MFNAYKRLAVQAVPLVLGLGVAAVAISAGEAGSTAAPVRCEIQASATGGMISLQGVVHADAAVSGSYRFRITGGGNSGGTDISQGGNFAAGPNGAATLGKVMLGGSGAIYDANLEVTVNGTTVACSERVGGAI